MYCRGGNPKDAEPYFKEKAGALQGRAGKERMQMCIRKVAIYVGRYFLLQLQVSPKILSFPARNKWRCLSMRLKNLPKLFSRGVWGPRAAENNFPLANAVPMWQNTPQIGNLPAWYGKTKFHKTVRDHPVFKQNQGYKNGRILHKPLVPEKPFFCMGTFCVLFLFHRKDRVTGK